MKRSRAIVAILLTAAALSAAELSVASSRDSQIQIRIATPPANSSQGFSPSASTDLRVSPPSDGYLLSSAFLLSVVVSGIACLIRAPSVSRRRTLAIAIPLSLVLTLLVYQLSIPVVELENRSTTGANSWRETHYLLNVGWSGSFDLQRGSHAFMMAGLVMIYNSLAVAFVLSLLRPSPQRAGGRS